MIEIVHGQAQSPHVANQLAEALRALNLEGTLYLGYPVLASSDDPVTVDGLLITKEYGAVIFILDRSPSTPASKDEWQSLRDAQDEVAFALQANLSRSKDLRRGRGLAFDIGVITVLPEEASSLTGFEDVYTSTATSPDVALSAVGKPVESKYWKALNASIQKVTTIKPRKKRSSVQKEGSRGALLRRIEAEIANLDRFQKWAAIESPEGPQRIRGLAGSGKTVVLALKGGITKFCGWRNDNGGVLWVSCEPPSP